MLQSCGNLITTCIYIIFTFKDKQIIADYKVSQFITQFYYGILVKRDATSSNYKM